MKQTYYDLLGVSGTATTQEIQKAYQAKVDYYRSEAFTGSPEEVREKIKEVTGAYNMVGDPCERMKYDNILKRFEKYGHQVGEGAKLSESMPKAVSIDHVVATGLGIRNKLIAAVLVLALAGGLIAAYLNVA